MKYKVLLLSMLVSLVVSANDETFADGTVTVNYGSHQLAGGAEYGDLIYGMRVHVDQIVTPGGKAYILPENYKTLKYIAYKDQPLSNRDDYQTKPYSKFTCPGLDGPGIRAFTAQEVKTGINCSWKSKNGSDADVIDFKLTLIKPLEELPPEQFMKMRNYRANYKNLSGELVLPAGSTPVSIKLDEADYRNGSNHKVWLRSNDGKGKENKERVKYEKYPFTMPNEKSEYKLRLVTCNDGLNKAGNIDVITSKGSPTVECHFALSKREKGLGWVPYPTLYTVTLQK